MSVLGLHHVTAICGDPQRNVAFYTGTLGMRLVKRTVNYEDPSTWHLYYGDAAARPGSLLTFFAWPLAERGRQGTGRVNVVSLAIAPTSMGFWLTRLMGRVPDFTGPVRRGDRQVLAFRDPDGLPLELVTSPAHAAPVEDDWVGPVPAEHAIRGVHAVTLWADGAAPTAALLTGALGLRDHGEVEERVRRYATADEAAGAAHVRDAAGFWEGKEGVGTVHHVAFRVRDEAAAAALRDRLLAEGLSPTDVVERTYFRSVYVREPGGVLFELATEGPGMAVNEPPHALGERLVLPPWLEPERALVEERLPPIHDG